jgi:hypothetical protein
LQNLRLVAITTLVVILAAFAAGDLPAQIAGPEGDPPAAGNGLQSRSGMSSQELAGKLAGAKDNYLLVQNTVINGPLTVPADTQPLQARVEFRDCEFTDDVDISKANFDRSILFHNVTFDKAFTLENIHIKGDLQLEEVTVAGGTITLNQTEIDGDLRISRPVAKQFVMERLTAANVVIYLTEATSRLDLTYLSSGRLSISGKRVNNVNPEVKTLNLDNATLRQTLVLKDLTIENLSAVSLSVDKRTQFLPATYIKGKLNLTSANLGNLEWTFPFVTPGAALPLPEEVMLNGTVFGNLYIAPVPQLRTAAQSNAEEQRLRGVEEGNRIRAERRDYGLDFLQKGSYFEAAYLAYEASLKARGRSDAADGVYFAMRDRRRFTAWRDASGAWEKITAGFNYLVGFGHKWLFGYGRTWTYPLVWCVAFIVTGAFFFDLERMEKASDRAPHAFSRIWYSIDIFVPILKLGFAEDWRPKHECRFLLFYSKFLSLAGLVFLSAMAGALTGSLK